MKRHARHATRAARLGDDAFRLLVESVRDYAIFMLDPTGIVIGWNAGARNIKGYEADEIIGHHFSRFYTEEDLRDGKPDRELRIAVEQGAYREEGWRVRKDGSVFWASVVITAIRDESGALIGFGKVTRDLTQRREIDEHRSRFIANASHELRTPVTSILGFTEALVRRDELTPETEKQVLDALGRAGDRLLTLVANLLDLTRLEQGHLEMHEQPVDVASAIRYAMETVPVPEGKTVTVNADTPRVLADHDRLQQILTNVLSNAYRYGGNTIAIDAQRRAGGIAITISDDGDGVPPAAVAALFEPFTRGGNTTGLSGSGLGLSIVRSLVEAQNGTVDYAPNVPKGARFTITLRAAP